MLSKDFSRPYLWLSAIALSFSLFPIVGCRSALTSDGQDNALITEGSEREAKQPQGEGSLWPLKTGLSWQTLTYAQNKTSTDSEIRVMGNTRLSDGRIGIQVNSYRHGKLFRLEVYHTDSTGNLSLLALGQNTDKMLLFTPEIPVLRSPTKEGQGLSWNGIARSGEKKYNAIAYHRISGVEEVKTPFETIHAFRLDSLIRIINANQHVDFPAVLWFVPGKGPAQRRLANRGERIVETITRFTGS